MRSWRQQFDKILTASGLKGRTVPITDEERAFLDSIFVPQYYARLVGLAGQDRARLFSHFLRHGLSLNLSPSPLFDREYFVEQAGPSADRSEPDVLRWFRTRRSQDITALRTFDPAAYRELYRDVDQAGIAPYEHFLLYGVHEGRHPNALFDAKWYATIIDRRPGEENMPPFVHFLLYGFERGAAPCVGLLAMVWRTPTARTDPADAFARTERAIRPWIARLGIDRTRMLLLLFNPDTYTGRGECPRDASGLQRLEHFLEKGIQAGIDPGPLFDSDFYSQQVGLSDLDGDNRLLHFLEHGVRDRVVPTPLFKDAVYAEAWPDMRTPELWGFAHFVEHGIFEGRRIDGSERSGAWSLPPDTAGGQFHNWELFWRESGVERSDDEPAPAAQAVGAGLGKDWSRAIADHDLPLVRALFEPSFYAKAAGLDPHSSAESLLNHFLQHGLEQDLAPGPLFDPAIARALTGTTDEPALLAWLKGRQPNWRSPTQFFDKAFYRSYHRDFHGVDFDLFEHYAVHGVRENRLPTFAFDPVWYEQAYVRPNDEKGMPAYLHYLLHGAERGLAPSRLLLTTFDQIGDTAQPGLDDYIAICRAGAAWVNKLDADKMLAMIAMFCPYTYDGGGALSAKASGPQRLVDYLDRGIQAGLTPSQLFDPTLYDKTGLDPDEPPFVNYLRKGWPKKKIASRLYTEESYQSAHADIRSHNIWGFRHFLIHGMYEGRKIDECARLSVYSKADEVAARELNSARIFWAASGVPSDKVGLPGLLGRVQQRLNQILTSPELAETMKRALNIDPVIGDIRVGEGYYSPPFHDPANIAMQSLHERIPNRRYGTVICVPWIRVGGADLVACQLAEAAQKACLQERVLLLRVDHNEFDRPDWIPKGVDVAHVADIFASIPQDLSERLLFTLIQAIEPKRVINVNSLRTWRTFERFGNRLRPQVNIYSYLFCWDQTLSGHRVGYPSMFYPGTAGVLSGIFTDTLYLRDELIRIYRPPSEIAERTVALFTPSRTEESKVSAARKSAETRSGKRPKVLWAGRLDRQKRFDLVQLIAQKMPHVDFHCWGDVVLDTPPDSSLSPKNLTLRSGFKDYSELPFEDADLWLFTSAWEGMPTILIEISIRGMSVVASQVGGVPELIDETTGFPVTDVADVDSYVQAVQYAIDNPNQRVSRAERLKKKAAQRYSQKTYIADLRSIFEREG